MNKIVLGITAHVDAGKTTLSEAMLYLAGKIRSAGRVDHGNTLLDTHELERSRGITIFAGQSSFTAKDTEFTLLDTPGHVDFSAETERMLQVLDYAALVISGADGVQPHTRTLWKLLSLYRIPTFIFVTKMDYAAASRDDIMTELKKELDTGCTDFSPDTEDKRCEEIAVCDEALLENYLESGCISDCDTARLIRKRIIFPCYFGSGLKLTGVDEFIEGLSRFTKPPVYPEAFGAKVFKITHDPQGNRITHMKITGGALRVRDAVTCSGKQEKISQLRIYSGAKFITADEITAGGICSAVGLSAPQTGDGLGKEASAGSPLLEPVMTYRIVLPEGKDTVTMLPKLKQLEEEDPQLRITLDRHTDIINVGLMGEIQAEIIKYMISERFHTDVEIDSGGVVYRETIAAPVEGVGHYEPLRHYAEVHLILEPLPRGSGLKFATECGGDSLDFQYQNQILSSLAEKKHIGVLTGSPVTDMKITLMSGRAHIKHTEGGDFRQAALRAVRNGLMKAQTVLLEPYYSFTLELPTSQIGRAMSDIRIRYGSFDSPENFGDISVLRGTVPVETMQNYASAVASYTEGRGRLSLEISGYDVCHDQEAAAAKFSYDPESDTENTPDSVFCTHGSGFTVKWDKVTEYMHLESCLKKASEAEGANKRRSRISNEELEAIMLREFGPIKRPSYRMPEVKKAENMPGESGYIDIQKTTCIIIDGYNVIHAWQELRDLAESELDHARERLMHILSNYKALTGLRIILVFDAYNVRGGTEHSFEYRGIEVVYTKEHETADTYIEKLAAGFGKNDRVRVVTSDALIQLSALGSGVMRMSASEFEHEIGIAVAQMRRQIDELDQNSPASIGERLFNR